LALFDVQAVILIDAANGSGVGAAFVDGDHLRNAVQIDGALEVSPSRRQVTLGSQKKVHCIAWLVHRAVQVFPLTGDFDVGLVHSPTGSHGTLAAAKDKGQDRQDLQCPAVYRSLINKNASFLHHLFNVAQAQRVCCIPASVHTSMTSNG
jgi:hypothetical protein